MSTEKATNRDNKRKNKAISSAPTIRKRVRHCNDCIADTEVGVAASPMLIAERDPEGKTPDCPTQHEATWLESLKTRGYCILEAIVPQDTVRSLRTECNRLALAEYKRGGSSAIKALGCIIGMKYTRMLQPRATALVVSHLDVFLTCILLLYPV
jgi:hypothetical protein